MTGKEISRVIWITGAGKGIGRELAKHYAGNGWTVAVSARTLADLQTLASELPVRRVNVFQLDVTDTEAVKATVHKIEDELGPLDVVILNAGTHVPTNARELSLDDTRHLVETNFMGAVIGIAAAAAMPITAPMKLVSTRWRVSSNDSSRAFVGTCVPAFKITTSKGPNSSSIL